MIFKIVRGQVLVAGMGSVIGLNHLAVWEAIDRYKVSDKIRCFEKVNAVFYHLLIKQRAEEPDEE